MTRIVQEHHIKYKERDGYDETVFIYKGEHQILTLINLYTRKTVSKGFVTALSKWLKENRKRAKPVKSRVKKNGTKRKTSRKTRVH